MLAIPSFKLEEIDETVTVLISEMQGLLHSLRHGAGDDHQLLYDVQWRLNSIRGKLNGKYDDRFKGVPIIATFKNTQEYQQDLQDLRNDLPPLSPMRED